MTDYVHSDGSVTRKIEMRNLENKFKTSTFQVPFDSTWIIKDSLELDEKGDTTWIKRAEKLFKNVDDINLAYKNDSGANREILRHAEFKRSFKWFNTEYRFAEKIDRNMFYGYPVSEFLNPEELAYFYSPDNIRREKQIGPDSLKYRAFEDTISYKSDLWILKSTISEWIVEFSKLTKGNASNDMTSEALKSREDEFVNLMKVYEPKLDSLWSNGIILKKFIGEENALKYKTEADSAVSIVAKRLIKNFKEYTVRIAMPGDVLGSNVFIDSSKVLLWPVKDDFFLTESYEMWDESKTANRWA